MGRLCAAVLIVSAWLAPAAAAVSHRATRGARPVPVPASGRPVDTSRPSRVVGHGTPASCTSAAVIAAVRAGGIIRFSCGPAPVVITMTATAKVRNTSSQVVLDGGGLVTLRGDGRHRILYMDTCDPAQIWTTSHCQDQATPRLTVQNLAFANGNSIGQDFDGGGGGAVFDRGGRLRIVDSVFAGNRCERSGPDIGGGAVRALSQYHGLPVYVAGSRFTANVCSNGAALSSIGVSWTVLNSTFTANRAIGIGANPARPRSPGGGSGGAIYNDGDRMKLTIAGSTFLNNHANEGGGAIFFVSNDRTGVMSIAHSTLERNRSDRFQTPGLQGIYFLGAARPAITDSVLR
jgi:Chlamydia polymorphic membrane protein (Chlamydia_PMP) repeat